MLGSALVWPQRICIPLLPEAVAGPAWALALRTRGLLAVCVVRAQGLPVMDASVHVPGLGTLKQGMADPQVYFDAYTLS